MHFNVIALASLAALASAAPATLNDDIVATSTSSHASSHASTSTHSSSQSAHSGTTHRPSHTASHTPVGTASGAGSNLPTPLAAKLAKEMHGEVTAIDRFNDLLSDDAGNPIKDQKEIEQRLVFDFNAAPAAGTGGRILVANEKNYPILTELGIAGAVAFLKPCSMNTPHTHPRATELLTLVKGSKLQTGMMLENNFRAGNGALTTELKTELSPFQATVFPQGSIHFQFNPTCEEATFVAALSSSDPGTSQVAQNFFFEDERIVNITLGQPKEINAKDIERFRKDIPANLVQAMDTCLAKCGKTDY